MPEKWLDLSHHNTVIDWDDIAANFDGVVLKLTEGNTYVDPTFSERYNEATKRGLKVQAYHFARFKNEMDARAEAEFHLQNLGNRTIYNDEVNLDIETDDYKLSKAELTGCVMEFAKTVSRLKDYNTVVYSYPSFLRNELEKFNLPIWLADYSSDGHYTEEFTKDGYKVIMIQYTSKGLVPGVSGNVDLDRRLIITNNSVGQDSKSKPKSKNRSMKLIRKGDKGPQVKDLQEKLLKSGEKLPRFGADGDFGDETEVAVKSFQKKHGLTVDGIVGPKTLDALESALKNKKKNSSSSAIVPYPGKPLKFGSRGKDVKRVQHALNLAHESTHLVEDGIFGKETEKAVKSYQKRHHLKVDGIVGPQTWSTLF